MKKVLVCGGRDFGHIPKDKTDPLKEKRLKEYFFVFDTLTEMLEPIIGKEELIIISGCATGPDTIALVWAKQYDIDTKEYPADWITHGKAAGPIRNREMLKEGKPDWVIAFPGDNGTADMVKISKAANITVKEIKYNVVDNLF